MKALILAAGYATRLYPLTKYYSKALLKIKGRPVIDYIVDKLNQLEGIDEIIVVTNSKFIAQFKDWVAQLNSRKPVTLLDDLTSNNRNRRGAIGDTAFAIEQKRLKDDLLVIGSDNLFNQGLKGLISFAKEKTLSSVIGIYDIKDKTKASRYGVIKLDEENKIIDFQEKPKAAVSTLVAMCLYYFPGEKLNLIKDYMAQKNNQPDATGFYIDWLRRKEPTYGYLFQGRWYDIGDAEFYKAAQANFLS